MSWGPVCTGGTSSWAYLHCGSTWTLLCVLRALWVLVEGARACAGRRGAGGEGSRAGGSPGRGGGGRSPGGTPGGDCAQMSERAMLAAAAGAATALIARQAYRKRMAKGKNARMPASERMMLLASAGVVAALFVLRAYRKQMKASPEPEPMAQVGAPHTQPTVPAEPADHKSSPEPEPTRRTNRASKPAPKSKSKYAAVISHHTNETAQARAMATALSARGNVVLDSEQNPDLIESLVREADVVVLLLSASVLEKTQVLIALMTAVDVGVPIVAAEITSGPSAYNIIEGAALLTRLETRLSAKEASLLRKNGIMVTDAAYKLSVTFDAMAKVQLEADAFESAADGTTSLTLTPATMEQLMGLVVDAETTPLSISRDDWFKRRDGWTSVQRSTAGATTPRLAPELPSAHSIAGDSRGKLHTEARSLLTSSLGPVVKVSLRGSGGAGKVPAPR